MKVGFSRLAAGVFLLAASFGSGAQATAIDKQLTVNVFQLCDGSSCAALGQPNNAYFASQTNDIWSQAGIKVAFNFVQSLNTNAFYDIDDSDFFTSLDRLAGAYANSSSVNLFLVNSINAGSYGETKPVLGGVAIAMPEVLSFNNGAGRVDTVAHELGHTLGLLPASLGGDSDGHSSVFYDLMADGATRCIPGTTCSGALPEGTRVDYLTPDEVAYARSSSLLSDVAPVPEPGEWAMMGLGLALTGGIARRRKARAAV